jgi:hypothetical protein
VWRNKRDRWGRENGFGCANSNRNASWRPELMLADHPITRIAELHWCANHPSTPAGEDYCKSWLNVIKVTRC